MANPTKTVYPVNIDKGYYEYLLSLARNQGISLSKFILRALEKEAPFKKEVLTFDCSEDLNQIQGLEIPEDINCDWAKIKKWEEDNQEEIKKYETVQMWNSPRIRV